MTRSFDEEEYDAEEAERKEPLPAGQALVVATRQAREALRLASSCLEQLNGAGLNDDEALASAAVLGRLTTDVNAAVETLETTIQPAGSRQPS